MHAGSGGCQGVQLDRRQSEGAERLRRGLCRTPLRTPRAQARAHTIRAGLRGRLPRRGGVSASGRARCSRRVGPPFPQRGPRVLPPRRACSAPKRASYFSLSACDGASVARAQATTSALEWKRFSRERCATPRALPASGHCPPLRALVSAQAPVSFASGGASSVRFAPRPQSRRRQPQGGRRASTSSPPPQAHRLAPHALAAISGPPRMAVDAPSSAGNVPKAAASLEGTGGGGRRKEGEYRTPHP